MRGRRPRRRPPARARRRSAALAQPGDDPALALGVRHGEVREARLGLAGIEQRLQLEPGVSCATPSPSNTPTAIVSAWVSSGAEVVVDTCIRRRRLRQYDAAMPKTVILGSARTPIGKLGGGLSTLKATELGGVAISAALERASVDPEQVDHVVMGQVLQAGQGQIPSRQAQIGAGIPKEVSSETVNKVCASGPARERDPRPGDPRRATSRSASAAAWSRCRRRPTCCRRRASAIAWVTQRRSTRWSTTV